MNERKSCYTWSDTGGHTEGVKGPGAEGNDLMTSSHHHHHNHHATSGETA